jgi:AbrB family looped-hinge helix DNA binding protein
MNPDGRITVPAKVRSALGLTGSTRFELEMTGNVLVLRPAIEEAEDDAWAYTPEHLARLERSPEQARQGKTYRLSEADLERIALSSPARTAC